MLPVTIFTVMMNNCQQDVTSCLFSFIVMAGGGGGGGVGGGAGGRDKKKTVAPKIPRVVCLSHPCTFRHSSEGRQIRPAELGMQPEFKSSG